MSFKSNDLLMMLSRSSIFKSIRMSRQKRDHLGAAFCLVAAAVARVWRGRGSTGSSETSGKSVQAEAWFYFNGIRRFR